MSDRFPQPGSETAAMDRRREPRFVVEGLTVSCDGRPVDVLDVSATALRLWWPETHGDPPAVVTLHLAGERGRPQVDAVVVAQLLRQAPGEAVYAYPEPMPGWRQILPRFDTFLDLRVPVWEA